MNRTLPLAIVIVVIAVLAVEGKLTALISAITTNTPSPILGDSGGTVSAGESSGGSAGSGAALSLGIPAPAPSSSPPSASAIGSGISGVGSSLSDTIAAHAYNLQHMSDPSLANYFFGFTATNNPDVLSSRQSFINCYLAGNSADYCSNLLVVG